MMLLAPFSSCCYYDFWPPLHPVPKWENTMEKITSRQQNTMPLKDGEAPKFPTLHGEASPDLRAAAPAADPGKKKPLDCSKTPCL